MGILSNLEPKEVFHYFEEICSIPHPSYKEEKISNYLVDFAKERGLEYYQDELKNVIIIKEATKGYEDVEPLILQGHMDMVCEKEPDCTIDFEKDGLSLEITGDYISAKGTTLGGDDGIALAYALAVLDSDSILHPRIEFVCTVSEEVGMEGATGIDLSMLKGKRLLNLDSEEEGILLVGCAGGCSAECTLPLKWQQAEGETLELAVEGLVGGHSGAEIDKGRGNSNILMGRILMEALSITPVFLAELEGGNKDNAIPRETKAKVVVKDGKAFREAVERSAKAIKEEFSITEPDMEVLIKTAKEEAREVLDEVTNQKVITLLNTLPNGIQTMSANIPGLVETSLNLGRLRLNKNQLSLCYATRSSVGTAKKYLLQKMDFILRQFGGTLQCHGDYPAWEYKKDSKLRETMVEIYEEMYGKTPEIQAIHAGLECGILAGKIEGLDCVSIGPDMVSIHTTQEKLSVSSTKRVWEYLLEVIKRK
ncbi:MAG: aminoacyl-histidine dipeptidase [Lachnospiraceae bacterium]|nr:aminoacyl-histidine dipeptidase [Lachnospiraceae bacterium]